MAKPTSKVAIVNLALGHLKVDPVVSIEPPDEDSKEASAGAKWYDQARRHVLEDHPWKFAQKRAELLAETDAPLFEYDAKYQLPQDYIRLNRIGESWYDPEGDYEIEGDYLLCNEESPLKIVYGWDLKDVTKFSPKFITALSFALAAFMSYEITGNAGMASDMWDKYTKMFSTAASVGGQNRPTRRVQRSKLAAARQTGRRQDWRRW
jgi:hypothetical protein